jgi:hypothetical protein
MGNLGSFALGFLAFVLTVPVRVEQLEYDCVAGTACPSVTNCYTLLGWENVLGPLGCSRWAAAGVGLAGALIARALGAWRERHGPLTSRPERFRPAGHLREVGLLRPSRR